MKFIHCSDLHIDAPTESRLPSEKARERRNELLSAFGKLADTATDENVRAVIVAGDLFDRSNVSKRAKRFVTETIASHPNTDFLILAGNHDSDAFDASDVLPENMIFLTPNGEPLCYGNVCISAYSDERTFDASKINVTVFHGAIDVDVNVSDLFGKGIDYLALGHYHTYAEHRIDARGVACYSGCLEGRSFDECGVKGFVIIDTDGGTLKHTFVPSSIRTVTTLDVDMSDAASFSAQKETLEKAVGNFPRKDILRVNIVGTYEAGREKYYGTLCSALSDEFYYIECRDKSVLKIEPSDYINDVSLKGEFIRLVMEEVSDEEERSRIITCGIKALMGNLE